ncbi:cyclic nucleotide-binding-like protein [Aspergillus alliaceus]|uniref:cAMP-dependent protein kinase regulatory subunit n=1 Tax=Petromyces alliaceus TaxID=209559 RepID=A0A5N7C3V5_PETAA|nr:cyclic nucleotide-binding-like protein [Aspergillus alliaceus]
MAESSFPGANPHLKVGTKDDKTSAFQKISEDEEWEVTSPTDPTFRSANSAAASSSAENNLFGGSAFQDQQQGGGIRFRRSPFGDASGDGDEDHDDFNEHPEGARPTGALNEGFPNNYALGRRTSVSAESLNPTSAGSDSWVPPHHPKSEDQVSRLKTAPIPAKDIKVISQGDAGDYFYIVEDGHFDVYIHPSGSVQSGPDGMGTKAGTIGPGGSFGELALMYNAPRAATIVSTDSKSTLWALDRITFRRILMDSAFQRRRMYEAFLEEVPLLSSLKPYERSKIADALDAIKYSAGSTIIKEGDPGDAFYLLESGEAEAFMEGVDRPVKSYKRGDFFGELALLADQPRAASVVAKTDVKVAKLGRDGFKRLLGPVEEIMRRAEYEPKPAAS